MYFLACQCLQQCKISIFGKYFWIMTDSLMTFDDLSKNWNFLEICVIRYMYCIPSIFIRRNVTKCMFFLIEYQPEMSYIKSLNKVCQWLATGMCFSPVSSTNNTDSHDITEILLKMALNTITHIKITKNIY
jgi:hypothetical protein